MRQLETVNYAVDGAVATVSMNRPEALNAFDRQLRFDLSRALEEAANDDSARVVLLRGEGRVFGAGADLTEEHPTDARTALMEEWWPSARLIGEMPKPVIAVVQGAAAGVHIAFVMACDLAIMADDARLVTPFSNIGLIPDGGANWLLLRQLGYKRAFRIAAESRPLSASEALELGLVNRLAPADELDAQASAWAQELAERAPLALAGVKKMMRLAADTPFEEAYEIEANVQAGLTESADHREGVAAFLGKRKPDFKGA
jgi:2-(1,2-epoxy-1,2-dihydrophenyl)acetyl-CoA isomerase